jgi:hypothetical protein
MSNIEDALGIMQEIYDGDRKRRVVLPVSHYVMQIELEETGLSKESETDFVEDVLDVSGNPVPRGNSPYAQLLMTVSEGPFEGESFSSRIYLTPGKGKYIGFHVNACNSITHKPTDSSLYKEFGFTFEDGWTGENVQKAFRFYFYNLEPTKRQDFMLRWARVPEWDGKQVVVKVGHELETRTNDDGEEYEITFNRIKGLWSTNDPKKGAAFVKKSCYPFQQQRKTDMDLGG